MSATVESPATVTWDDPQSGMIQSRDDNATITHIAFDREFVNCHGETVQRYVGRIVVTPTTHRRVVGLACQGWRNNTLIQWTIPRRELIRAPRHRSKP